MKMKSQNGSFDYIVHFTGIIVIANILIFIPFLFSQQNPPAYFALLLSSTPLSFFLCSHYNYYILITFARSYFSLFHLQSHNFRPST